MAINNEFVPQVAIHPGHILLEEIKSRHMSQVEFAERTGITPKHMSEIVNGKADVTPEVAMLLESATGTPARMWMTLQMQYDEIQARQKAEECLDKDVEAVKLFPYNEIQKIWSFLPNTRKPRERVVALRQFFCVSSLSLFVENIDSNRFTISASAFRTTGQSACREIDRYALASWVQIGQLQAAKGEIEYTYNQTKLKKMAKQIPEISAMPDLVVAWSKIKQGLTLCGVKVVLVPYISRTYVNGAVYWEDETPVIVLNAKSSYWDSFIFTLLHEIGHILMHGKYYSSLSFDETHVQQTNNNEETEADQFSLNTLISHEKFESFLTGYHGSEQAVREFANSIPVDAGVVGARMAKENYFGWPYCNRFRRRVKISP